jgi:TolB-like protein
VTEEIITALYACAGSLMRVAPFAYKSRDIINDIARDLACGTSDGQRRAGGRIQYAKLIDGSNGSSVWASYDRALSDIFSVG